MNLHSKAQLIKICSTWNLSVAFETVSSFRTAEGRWIWKERARAGTRFEGEGVGFTQKEAQTAAAAAILQQEECQVVLRRKKRK